MSHRIQRLRLKLVEMVPARTRRWLRAGQRRYRLQRVRAGAVDFGGLRRLTPVSRVFGLDRGLPIDRYYIDQFVAEHATDIRGRVLEIGDDSYTRRFGDGRVVWCDVLHVLGGNPSATIVADLTRAGIASNSFDCIILTQTLQMIYDVRAALEHLHRILKPYGVLLVTANGISRIARREGIDPWGEYWRFTAQSARRLFHEVFSPSNVEIEVRGNVLSAICSLMGLSAEELTAEELDCTDLDYEVLIAIRAVKECPALGGARVRLAG